MIRDALFLARKDLRHLFREWSTWFWAFLMPIVFFYFIGAVTGGMAGQPPSETIGLFAGEDSGFLVDEFVHQLESVGYKMNRVNALDLGSTVVGSPFLPVSQAAFWPANKAQFRSAGREPV